MARTVTQPVIAFLIFGLLPATREAPLLRGDPKRPVDQISHDLGFTPGVFRTCFAQVQPALQGDQPTQERKHRNKSVLLNCLQKSNPLLNNEYLDAVMDRYRPGGRPAQEATPQNLP